MIGRISRPLVRYASTTSNYYSRPLLENLLSRVPRLIAPLDPSQFNPLFDSGDKFIEKNGHIDKLLDNDEPVLDTATGDVRLSKHTHGLVAEYIDSGFHCPDVNLELPYTLATALGCITSSAFTTGVFGHSVLTSCAALLLKTHGSDALKERYYDKMISGEFFGTMALSEPNAGSSLATNIKTTATDLGDGTYSIVGTKMWTSAADHDMDKHTAYGKNIVHMLLANTPAGVSLFVVPKYLDDDNTVRNSYVINGLNHKLGCRGLSNAYWSLGDDASNPTLGFLVGKEGKGLHCMFVMMNAMRVHVGVGASITGLRGYRESLAYALERKQGRIGKSKEQVPIIKHADVRRLLLTQKAYCEGGLALCLFAANLVDRAGENASDAKLLDALTPIIKSWPSDYCTEANNLAIQVLGGYGYTRDFQLNQFWRDNRLNMIHEGTAGIQSLDLLGRKTREEGWGIMVDRVRECAGAAAGSDNEDVKVMAGQLEEAVSVLEDTKAKLFECMNTDPSLAMSNSHEFMNMSGHTVVGWIWLELAMVAADALKSNPDDAKAKFYRGQIQAAKWFFVFEVGKVARMGAVVGGLDRTVLDMDEDWM
jgi:alkylation response protein AidB-like acyl-CoA dehydrogenase